MKPEWPSKRNEQKVSLETLKIKEQWGSQKNTRRRSYSTTRMENFWQPKRIQPTLMKNWNLIQISHCGDGKTDIANAIQKTKLCIFRKSLERITEEKQKKNYLL